MRALSFLSLALCACGSTRPLAPEPTATAEPPARTPEAAQPATVDWEGPGPDALAAHLDRLRAQRDREGLLRGVGGSEAIAAWTPQDRWTQFYVHEDVPVGGDVGSFDARCQRVEGKVHDEGLVILKVNERRRGACAQWDELHLQADRVAVYDGGDNGRCGDSMGVGDGGTELPYALVAADETRAVYAMDAVSNELVCEPGPARAPCPAGGTAGCTVLLPVLQSDALGVSGGGGGGGGASLPPLEEPDACSVSCAAGACEEVVARAADAFAGVYYAASEPMLAVFRARAACLAWARERAPIRQSMETPDVDLETTTTSPGRALSDTGSASSAASPRPPRVRIETETLGPEPFLAPVTRMVRARSRAMLRCVEVLDPPATPGRVAATVAVEPDGLVTVSPPLDAASDPRQRCLVDTLRRFRFHPGPTETQTFEVRLTVVPSLVRRVDPREQGAAGQGPSNVH